MRLFSPLKATISHEVATSYLQQLQIESNESSLIVVCFRAYAQYTRPHKTALVKERVALQSTNDQSPIILRCL